MVSEKIESQDSDYSQHIRDRIEKLQTKVKDLCSINIKTDVQIEIGKLIQILQIFLLEKEKFQEIDDDLKSILELIDFAVSILACDNPNLAISKEIRHQIEYFIRSKNNNILVFYANLIHRFLHIVSNPLKVIIGLLITLPIYITITLTILFINNKGLITQFTYVSDNKTCIAEIKNENQKELVEINSTDISECIKNNQKSYQRNISILVLISSAGGLGSIVSILFRIKDYDSTEYEDGFLPFIVGASKPIIGASFGILIFALVKSEIIPLEISEQKGQEQFYFYSIAFIIGFSERLASDIISRTENSLSGTRDNNQEKNRN